MTELIVSEITRMNDGFCVIGVERNGAQFRSVRPLPPRRYAWVNFPYQRGDKLGLDFSTAFTIPPHTEDRNARNEHKLGFVSEEELIGTLKQAEVGNSVQELFACEPHTSRFGGKSVYALPREAKRSICGCEIESLKFCFHFYPKMRVAIKLKSGERLASLPLVDADWGQFIGLLADGLEGESNLRTRLERQFSTMVQDQINDSDAKFVRIGLSRPNRDGLCWFMLDSLFPLPKKTWLE
jgi:hypothetical protein